MYVDLYSKQLPMHCTIIEKMVTCISLFKHSQCSTALEIVQQSYNYANLPRHAFPLHQGCSPIKIIYSTFLDLLPHCIREKFNDKLKNKNYRQSSTYWITMCQPCAVKPTTSYLHRYWSSFSMFCVPTFVLTSRDPHFIIVNGG